MSFDVHDGEVFGLLGPNGAGKTTTLECTIGLRDPDEGNVEVCGIDARRRSRAVKRKLGAALQGTMLQDRITPREALALFAALHGRHEPVAPLLDRFSLREKADAPFNTLSGGQRQKLALALAFVNTPEVIVLDEPTAGLDAHARRELHAEIVAFKREGRAVLLSTHDMDEAQQLCDRVAIMNHGRFAAVGAPADLIARSRASHRVLLGTATLIARELVQAVPGVSDLACDGNLATFRTSDVGGTLAALAAALSSHGIEIRELHVQRATLEDLFIELTS